MIPFVCAAMLLVGAPVTEPPSPPRLVVFFAIDQLRPDYLERYRAEWTGGFKRMLEQSAYFPNGRQDHGVTETAPGHASFLSGRFPSKTGIVTNSRSTQDAAAPLIGVAGPSASPRQFQGTTLFDWMRRRDGDAQVLSVSRKERGAILPVGRALGEVYWFAGGRFTTSRYYADTLPSWVTAYNARKGPERLAGRQWDLFAPAGQYTEIDSMDFENGGTDFVFPHSLPSNPDSMASGISRYPWMDSLTLDLALEGVRAMQLGRRNGADLLVVALSATDDVGHDFGPDSRELHDMLLRLDHWLGWFLDSLAAIVPAEQTLFALSSDHGVQSFPEFTTRVQNRKAERVWLGDLADQVSLDLKRRYLADFDLSFDYGLMRADVAALRARGINVDSLARAMAAAAMRKPGVARVFTPASLRAAPAGDREARLWRHSLAPSQGWLIAGVLRPGYTWQETSGWTNHGSTNEQDVMIPLAFWGPGVRPGRHRRAVESVDIGPTLAALLGVRPTEPVDGEVLQEVVPPRRRPRSVNVERE